MRILVIGTGGDAKRPFLEALARKVTEVVVIDCEETAPSSYPHNVRPFPLKALSRNALQAALPDFRRFGTIDRITTIFEPCVEAAGFLRQQLAVNGLTLDESLVFRDKWHMYQEANALGLLMPNTTKIGRSIQQLPTSASGSWVLKPRRASGNLGVRIAESLKAIRCEVAEARLDAEKYCRARRCYFDNIASEWVLTEYIEGREIEVDLFVHRGAIKFCGIHEKTVLTRSGARLQEDNAITPPLNLTRKEVALVRTQCKTVADRIYRRFFQKKEIDAFVLYLEFRLRPDGIIYCLEFALRIGGGWVPLSLLRSTGVDVFELAAASSIGSPAPEFSVATTPRSIYWQLLYAPVHGTFVGLQGSKHLSRREILYLARAGSEVRVPTTEYVACVMFEDSTPERVSIKARRELEPVKIIVDSKEEGRVGGAVPLPPTRRVRGRNGSSQKV